MGMTVSDHVSTGISLSQNNISTSTGCMFCSKMMPKMTKASRIAIFFGFIRMVSLAGTAALQPLNEIENISQII